MVGDGNYIVTSSDLISDANVITIRFPNEDSIKAKIINSNPINNIAILKLINPPKTQRTPMLYSIIIIIIAKTMFSLTGILGPILDRINIA